MHRKRLETTMDRFCTEQTFKGEVWVTKFKDEVWVTRFKDEVWVTRFKDEVWVTRFKDEVWVTRCLSLRIQGWSLSHNIQAVASVICKCSTPIRIITYGQFRFPTALLYSKSLKTILSSIYYLANCSKVLVSGYSIQSRDSCWQGYIVQLLLLIGLYSAAAAADRAV